MSWDKEPPKQDEIEFAQIGSWDSEPPPSEYVKESGSMSALRKGLQGATFGLSDEAAGIVEGAGRALGFEGAGGPLKDISSAEGGPTLNMEVLRKAYEAGRNREREALKKDSKDNPEISTVAEFGGALLSPINKVGQGLSLAKQGAIMGGASGFGYSDSDTAMGVVGDTLLGTALGAAGGKAIEKGQEFVSKNAAKIPQMIKGSKQTIDATQNQSAKATAEGAAKVRASVDGGPLEVEQSGELFKFKAPKSLDELRNWNPSVKGGAIPGKERLKQIEQLVPDLETRPLKYHFDMMENPKAMRELKLKFENLPTADAKKIASYNQQIVEESAKKIDDTVINYAGTQPKNPTDAGYDFLSTVKDRYQAEKQALGPLFQEIEKRGQSLGKDEATDLVIAIGQNSKIGRLMNQDPNSGRFMLSKNTPRSGLSDSEHNVLARVIDDLNDGMTFKEIQATREYLRKAIDPANPGASEEISKVRSIMLGQLEALTSKKGPDLGETFKAYAKNERARENIEKIIGGRIESFDAMFAANPDKVVQKIFSNPNYVKVVGEYVGEQKMKELVGSYINTGIRKANDPAKGFNPSQLKTWLKTNDGFLRSNVEPEVVERLNALADYGYYGKRFLDEVNPSGTAASLKEMIEPKGFVQKIKQGGLKTAIEGEVAQRVGAMTKQRQAIKAMNEALGDNTSASKFNQKLETAMNVGKTVSDRFTKAAGSQGVGSAVQSPLGIPRVAEDQDKTVQNKPQKGPTKWINDGAEKLKTHGLKDSAKLEELKKSKKGRELLIRASDLKVGSQAMDKVVAQIQASYVKGGR